MELNIQELNEGTKQKEQREEINENKSKIWHYV